MKRNFLMLTLSCLALLMVAYTLTGCAGSTESAAQTTEEAQFELTGDAL